MSATVRFERRRVAPTDGPNAKLPPPTLQTKKKGAVRSVAAHHYVLHGDLLFTPRRLGLVERDEVLDGVKKVLDGVTPYGQVSK